jgi:hypothetical protein
VLTRRALPLDKSFTKRERAWRRLRPGTAPGAAMIDE